MGNAPHGHAAKRIITGARGRKSSVSGSPPSGAQVTGLVFSARPGEAALITNIGSY